MKIILYMSAMLTVVANICFAKPFAVLSEDEIRADSTISWADVAASGTVNFSADSLTEFTTANNEEINILPYGSTAEIRSSAGYFIADTVDSMLSHSGDGKLVIYPSGSIQGFGVTVEHSYAVQATYTVSGYDSDGELLDSVSVLSPGVQGNPAFLGLIDSDARIAIISIEASPDNTFVIADPVFQYQSLAVPTFSDLPVTATLEEPIDISQTATYLHEGYTTVNSTGATQQATVTNDNAYDLLALFPDLRPGDLLRFNRLGSGLNSVGETNQLLGVMSETNIIEKSTSFHRVPGAVSAGAKFYTKDVSGNYISTPTNIAEDFVIGPETHVAYREGARYLFLTRADLETQSNSVKLNISHISRDLLQEWIDQLGLVGANADLASDLDGDGLTLLEEFAYRKNPTESDVSNRADYSFAPTLNPYDFIGDSGSLNIAFGGRRDVPLRYTGEFSSDLKNWDTVTEAVELMSDGAEVSNAIFMIFDPAPGPKRFGRVLIDYIPANTP